MKIFKRSDSCRLFAVLLSLGGWIDSEFLIASNIRESFNDRFPNETPYYDPSIPPVPQNADFKDSREYSGEGKELTSTDHELLNFISFPDRGYVIPSDTSRNQDPGAKAVSYPFESDISYYSPYPPVENSSPFATRETNKSTVRSIVNSDRDLSFGKENIRFLPEKASSSDLPNSGEMLSSRYRIPAAKNENNELIAQISESSSSDTPFDVIPLAPESDAAQKDPVESPSPSETGGSVTSSGSPPPLTIITPDSAPTAASLPATLPSSGELLKEISVNFNNVAMVEYIRFLSRVSNKNFIFDDADLQFNVTIISEEPISVANFMSALLQELQIRDLSLIEQGNNIIIHRNPRVRAPARIVSGDNREISDSTSELVTRVFRLNTLDPVKASEIIRPLLSDTALVEVLRDTNNLIITDLVMNINKITRLIGTLDAPNSGVTIGQYVVKNAFVDSLVDLSTKIIQPIAQGNPFILVPHAASNSIYIVSNGFIVEKALAILQNLDRNEGRTKIFSLENLYPSDIQDAEEGKQGFYIAPEGYTVDSEGYLIGPDGRRAGRGAPGTEGYPVGSDGFVRARLEQNVSPNGIPGNGQKLLFAPDGYSISPEGFLIGSDGRPVYSGSPRTEGYKAGPDGKLRAQEGFAYPAGGGIGSQGLPPTMPSGYPGGQIGSEGRQGPIPERFLPGGIGSSSNWSQDLPVGHIERTLFSIYKLRYRRGDQIEVALRKIAISLQQTGTSNIDLLAAINSVQWIESSNALILTGTASALERVRDLVNEIDTPLRQVFIEMLILATTIEDSLQYGVQINQLSGGGPTTTTQGFNGNINASLASAVDFTTNPPSLGDIGGIFESLGYTASVIGTHITHNGTRFNSISAVVKALHQNTKTRIILNPKIITEDNTTAEIFVGTTDRYKTQSITNDLGTLVTNNFQFIDVGTTLRVTPLIGNNNVITLDIVQETSNGTDSANSTPGGSNSTAETDVNLVPVISTSRTQTRVHIPNGFFIILSGMIQDVESRVENRIPCLGGIPIIGGACKQKGNEDRKQNLMIFIRPLIVDTENELEDITKRQQDVFREKSKLRRDWNYEVDEALDQFNIKSTDPDEICLFEKGEC